MSKHHFESHKSSKNNSRNLIIGAAAGTVAGATAALLLTPKTGEQLRENIRDAYQTINNGIARTGKSPFSIKIPRASSSPLMMGAVGGGLLGVAAAIYLSSKNSSPLSDFAHKMRDSAAQSIHWINKAKELAETIGDQLNVSLDEVEEALTSNQSKRGGHAHEAAKWAVIGLNLLKNFQKRS